MEFKEQQLKDILEINPRITLKKGTVTKKIAMEHLTEYVKQVKGYELSEFKSGSKFKNQDTIVARITPCLENGKTAYVDILADDEVAFGSTEFFVVRAKENKGDPQFIYYLMRHPKVRDATIKSMTGTSGRQRAQKEAILEYSMSLPNIFDQKKIGCFLSLFDSKIEANNDTIHNLEQLSQTLFKHWFIDFEFPNEEGKPYKSSGGEMVESELGEIPKGWSTKSLDEIAKFQNGLAMQKFRPKENADSLPVLKIKELNQGNTTLNSERCSLNIKQEVKVFDGDVIFSWSGTLLVKLWTGGDAGLNQHLFKVTSEKYEKWFYYLWTKYYLKVFQARAAEKATTMGHIKRSHLKEAKIYLPPEKVLTRATDLIQPLIEKIIILGIENKNLTQLRDTLLPKLLSGEIEIPDDMEV